MWWGGQRKTKKTLEELLDQFWFPLDSRRTKVTVMINGWEKLLIKWEAINKNYGRFEIIWRSSILTQSSGINVAVLDWNFNLKYLLMGLKILNNQFIHDIINSSIYHRYQPISMLMSIIKHWSSLHCNFQLISEAISPVLTFRYKLQSLQTEFLTTCI